MRRTRTTIVGAVAAAALVGGILTAAAAPAAVSAPARATIHLRPMLQSRYASATQPPGQATCVAAFTVPCYDPAQIETAYNVQPLYRQHITGAGQTIVLVDAFGSPTIKTDLNTFDAAFGLPAPPSFQVIQPAGPVPAWNPATGTMRSWGGETTLDVEYSHAMAPGANILLVETPVAETEGVTGFPQIVTAENYVINHHLGDVISQSFGATEETFPTVQSLLSLRSAYINAAQHGVTVLAATGDTGSTSYSTAAGAHYFPFRAVDWPASDPLVTAVGGTQLHLNTAGARTSPDTVWNDTYNQTLEQVFFGTPGPVPLATTGGVSSIFPRPFYQIGVARTVGNHRGVPDVSMSGACSGLVITYQSFPGGAPGYYVVCGTSEASPLFAGVVALADQMAHHSLGLINPSLYLLSAFHAPGLVDVTQGNNTVSFETDGKVITVPGYSAGPGYDLASGVGTVNAALFVPELAQTGSPPLGHHYTSMTGS